MAIGFVTIALFSAAETALGLQVPTQNSQFSVAEILMILFFGFAVASFQEETIFRGFIQRVFTEKYGKWRGNIIQSAIFSLSHIGYYSLDAWLMFLQAFSVGMVFGWLRMKRSTLIAPWLAHGFLG